MNRVLRARGFTIVEVMAALLITLIIMAAVYALMLQNQRTYEQQTRLADVQQAARVAIDLMTREIRIAGSDPSRRAFNPDPACLDADYPTPANRRQPQPGDLGAITVAKTDRIRIKADRGHWALLPEPSPTPPVPATPAVKQDCNTDGDYDDDDEDLLGDGFIDDEGEDIEYEWDSTAQVLYRTERRSFPAGACQPCGAGTVSTSKQPIASNVVAFSLKYYSSRPPRQPCPVGVFVTETDYETARDVCDPPLPFDSSNDDQPINLLAILRVRIKLTVETRTADPFNPSAGPNQVTLVSEATIRNRL